MTGLLVNPAGKMTENLISLAAACARLTDLHKMTTRAPLATMSVAVALPMPVLAPNIQNEIGDE